MLNSLVNLLSFLDKVDHKNEKYFGPIPKSHGYISPGDILFFGYSYVDKDKIQKSQYVTVLVVEVDRGPGIFISTKNNKLLACYILDFISDGVLTPVLLSLYKNKTIISYRNIKSSLSSIFGSSNFRTYDFNKISGLQKINLDIDRLSKLDQQKEMDTSELDS